ncbi:sel1 repeat family protein [Streptomyces sp. NPDC029674]|uniref:sel1 repeat family protein n=1 Tax=Streptomyces sp. NPDC029674 TaxID=3365297 RepID=UPI00384D0A65
MATELEELAAEAADLLVGAMWADEARWRSVRHGFTEFFRDSSDRESRAELDLTLDRLRARRRSAASAQLRQLWTAALSHHLRAGGPPLTERLRQIVAGFAPGAAVDTADATGDFATDFTPWYTAAQPEGVKEAEAQAGPAARNSVTGGTQAAVVQADSIGSVTVNAPPAPQHAAADGWPRIDGLRRLGLGVRPTRRFPGATALPPYAIRDCDDELSVLLRQAAHYGGLVIVTGGPLSGKTSTAWAALRASVPDDTRVFVAGAGANLSDLPEQLRGREATRTHVVWLDDLDGHLAEPGTPGVLSRLIHDRVLVLATMRDEAYDRHRFGNHPAARVLSVAQTVEVPTEWSEAELARLATVDDPRFADALRWRGDLGVTEFLALGPDLWEEWRRARRSGTRLLGHLLVRATIDLARNSTAGALPLEALKGVADEYEEREEVKGETYEDALAWACAPRSGVAGLLVPGEREDTWKACGPLVAEAMRAPDFPVVDRYGWWAMVRSVWKHSPAAHGPLLAAARAALRPQGEAGDVDVMRVLAEFAGAAGDLADAKYWYRRVVEREPDSAMSVGMELSALGEYAEAVRHLETAGADGTASTAHAAARLHLTRAQYWFAQAAGKGDEQAAATLAHLRSAPAARPDTVKE